MGVVALEISHRRPWAVLAVLCTAVLVVNVDSTILNVALPTLVRSLQASSSDLQWIVDAYSMSFGGLLLVAGSIADRVGRKRMFLIGFATFAIASLGAALSGGVGILIAWRAVMGAGAAMTIPAGLSILDDVFRDPRRRARAVGIWGGTMGVGLAIGPLAGGLLLSRFSWGSVFLVNVPIVAFGAFAALRLLPESRNPGARRADPLGAVLSIAGLGLVLWAIIEAPTRGWASIWVLAAELAGALTLIAFIVWEARCEHPMLKLAFFRSRRFSAAITGLAFGMFPLFGAVFVLTQVLQFDLGYTALQAGVRILPTAGLVALAAPISTVIVRAVGSKLTAAAGLASVAAGMWWVASVASASASYGEMLPGMMLIGLGAGWLMPTAADSVLGSLPHEEAGVGSGTYGLAIQVGGALGVAVIGSMLSTRSRAGSRRRSPLQVPAVAMHEISSSLGGALRVSSAAGGARGALLAHAARAAFMSGTQLALGVGAGVAALAAAVVLLALPARPPEL